MQAITTGKIVAGALSTVLISILAFMGNGIVDNDVRNVRDHTAIREERTAEVRRVESDLYKKIEQVKDIVTDVKLEQREMITVQRMILAEIKK